MPGALNPFASAFVPPAAALSTALDIERAMERAPSTPLDIPSKSGMQRVRPVQPVHDDEEEEHGEQEHADEPAVDEEDPALFGDSDSLNEGDCDSPASPVMPGSNDSFNSGMSNSEAALAKVQAEMEQEANQGEVLCSQAKVGLPDFELLSLVGQGAFGKVFQVRYRRTGEVLAMKVMRKDRILQKDHSEYVRAERDVLTAVTHPYIVALRFSFQTPKKLYLVLDFLNGGHLFFNLYREGVFGEDVACLYTAEIVSALSYLHDRGIMHRDLKPENVLLDAEGHVRLTDFGLAKENVHEDGDRSNSFIGTMEYMAPEIIESKGHTKSVDWWSTGVLLYEMLCGVPPFRAKNRQALQQQILGAKPKFPKFLSTNVLNLLKGLLTRDPAKRLGSGPGGADAIRKHPFFKSINWAKLEQRQIESKFKPKVKCSLSIENFDKIWTDQPAEDSPCGTPSSHEHSLFKGFTYVQPSFIAKAMAAAQAQQPPTTV